MGRIVLRMDAQAQRMHQFVLRMSTHILRARAHGLPSGGN
jgi:hypothetical protein